MSVFDTPHQWLTDGLLDSFDKMYEAGRKSVDRPKMDKEFVIRGQVDYLLGTTLSVEYLNTKEASDE